MSSLPFERDEGTAFRIFLDLKSKHHFIMEKKLMLFFLCEGLQRPSGGALFLEPLEGNTAEIY